MRSRWEKANDQPRETAGLCGELRRYDDNVPKSIVFEPQYARVVGAGAGPAWSLEPSAPALSAMELGSDADLVESHLQKGQFSDPLLF